MGSSANPPPQNRLLFRAFTVKSSGLANRIVTEVKVTATYDPQNPPVPAPTVHSTSGLWDTGATGSCISKSLAGVLGLTPIGATMVSHAGGSESKNTYLINIHLPNYVALAGVLVAEFEETAQFGVIIGMDVIGKGDFSITNYNNQTWASFRIPSVQGIDYVQEANKINFLGTGRNDPCPCGKKDQNGKSVKFKRCHGLTI
jgi:hypothetical protein